MSATRKRSKRRGDEEGEWDDEELDRVGDMDKEDGDYDGGGDIDDADGEHVQVVSLTHHVLSPSLNLTQDACCFPHAHVYVSLLVYCVSHHHLLNQLILLHVHLLLCSRVLLCREERGGSLE